MSSRSLLDSRYLAVEAAARAGNFTAALSGVLFRGASFTKKLLPLLVSEPNWFLVTLAAVQKFDGVEHYTLHLYEPCGRSVSGWPRGSPHMPYSGLR